MKILLCVLILLRPVSSWADDSHFDILTVEYLQSSLGHPVDKNDDGPSRECAFQGRGGYRCHELSNKVTNCSTRVYFSPYPIAHDHREDCPGYIPDIHWGPAVLGSDGDDYVKSLKQAFQKPHWRSCKDITCQVVVQTNSVTFKGRSAIAYATCWVVGRSKNVGPPANCYISAIEWNGTTYLPLVTKFTPFKQWNGAPDYTIDVYSKSSLDPNLIMASIRQRLKLAPFALDTEAAAATAALPAASDLIVGVAGPRYSDTIDEYEWLTVRIDRVAPPTTGVRLGDYALSASIVITLSLLINRHNTLPLEDWHPAESTLFTSRLSDIRTALGMTLDKLCKASQWSNARQVLCEPKN